MAFPSKDAIVLNMAIAKKSRFLAFLLICLLFSNSSAYSQEENVSAPLSEAQVEQPQPESTPPDLEKLAETLLSEELEREDVIWVGESDEQFLGIWKPDTSGTPVGAVLILFDQGQTDFNSTVKSIGEHLPPFGWSTLAIPLPQAKQRKIPERNAPIKQSEAKEEAPTPNGEAEENTESSMDNMKNEDSPGTNSKVPQEDTPRSPTSAETMTEKADIDPEITAENRLKTALKYLNQQGQYNIVLMGYGINGARAVHFTASMSPVKANQSRSTNKITIQRPIRALILVSARNRLDVTNIEEKPLQSSLTDPGLPMLDVYFNNDYRDQTESKARKKSAKNKRIENYIQLKLLSPSELDFSGESRLSRRIRGFLERYAKGVEIEK